MLTARYCRAYLAACVSIVDAFINRHIWFANHSGLATADFTALKASTNAEERIGLWLKVFTGKKMTEINSDTEWKHFQSLREERNKLIHVIEPYYSDSIEEMSKKLNYVKAGTGGLLGLLRKLQGLPTLKLIRRLESAPEVIFKQKSDLLRPG